MTTTSCVTFLGLFGLDGLLGGADVVVGDLFDAQARQLLGEGLSVPGQENIFFGWGLKSTKVAFLLLNQWPRVQFSVFTKDFFQYG